MDRIDEKFRLRLLNERSAALVLVLVFTAVYFFSGVGLENSVDAPQFRLTQSIVDRHTVYLDGHDLYAYPDESSVAGHMISGRSPGESLLAIPFYVVAKALVPLIHPPYNGMRAGSDGVSGIEAATAIWDALCGGLAVWLVYQIALRLRAGRLASVLAALSFGLGSLIWKYASEFYRHAPETAFVLLAALYLLRMMQDGSFAPSELVPFALGLGGALLVDSSAVGFVVVTLLVLSWLMVRAGLPVGRWARVSLMVLPIIFVCVMPQLIYSLVLFGRPDRVAWQFQIGNPWLSDPAIAFSTPLLPSMLINLFNPNRAVPQAAFSPVLRNNAQLAFALGYRYVAGGPYRGIFFQSPYLFLVLPAFWVLRDKRPYVVLWLLGLAVVLPQFKFLTFYSPNSFDTRYFVPMVALLSPLIAPWLSFGITALAQRRHALWIAVVGVTSVPLILLSWFEGWVAELENYAPHLTGQHRALLADLITRHASVAAILRETFPNAFNYPVFALYAMACLGLFMLVPALRRELASPPKPGSASR